MSEAAEAGGRSARAVWPRSQRELQSLGLLLALACSEEERPGHLADFGGPAPIPGCSEFSYRPCDILDTSCQGELFELMACIRGEALGAASLPPVTLLSEAEAVERVRAASEAVTPAGEEADFSAQVRAFELLGLLEPGLVREASDVVSETVAGVVAFYLIPTREIFIIDRGAPIDDLEANATLAHELVHAMQDVRHGLSLVGAGTETDGALAASAVVEGEASVYQLLMMLAYEGVALGNVDFDAAFDNFARVGLEVTLETGSPLITASGIFPYTLGAHYVGAHWLRGELQAIDALYDRLPASSLEVMLAEVGGSAPLLHTFEAAPEPLAGYQLVASDVVGAWVTLGALAALTPDTAGLASRVTHWRGDRAWMYRGEDQAAAALWASVWEDAQSAEWVAELLRRSEPQGGALRVEVSERMVRVAAVERPSELEAWTALVRALPAP